VLGYAQVLVADDDDRGLDPPGDALDLVLHRAGVGVDEDAGGVGDGGGS